MSDDESSFLSRWSRLKRDARAPRPAAPPAPPVAGVGPVAGEGTPVQGRAARGTPDGGAADAAAAGAVPAAGAAAEESVDLDSLPPIDSLGADSDFTQFLRKGVPTALKNAALRKLWAADPAIANYRTFAEYDWDFNAPGYGQLLPTDDVKKAVDALFKTMDGMTGERPGAESGPETAAAAGGDDEPARPSAGPAEETGPGEPDLSRPQPLPASAPPASAPAVLPPLPQSVPPVPPVPAAAPVPVEAAPPGTPPRRRRHGGAVPR
ncbi:DUF3306 domain-containing protein [Oleisolibacter albus]|uniref:DUF3306 domain-containing protein n=1 Tax=Oleisolibacter albus TaxID=2171757 RepID=UPI000DF2E007|nr:DUF3306 domain-containing protein [Oleisolibacter albus]